MKTHINTLERTGVFKKQSGFVVMPAAYLAVSLVLGTAAIIENSASNNIGDRTANTETQSSVQFSKVSTSSMPQMRRSVDQSFDTND